MSIQEWLEIRSLELQTKEKEKMTEKGQSADTFGGPEDREAAEPRGDQQQGTRRTVKKGGKEAEEVSEMEVPLVRKWRRLMRVGDNVPTRENVSEETTSTRDVADQKEGDTGGGEGLLAPERSRLGDGGDGRQALPLVVVPFEPVAGEAPAARKK